METKLVAMDTEEDHENEQLNQKDDQSQMASTSVPVTPTGAPVLTSDDSAALDSNQVLSRAFFEPTVLSEHPQKVYEHINNSTTGDQEQANGLINKGPANTVQDFVQQEIDCDPAWDILFNLDTVLTSYLKLEKFIKDQEILWNNEIKRFYFASINTIDALMPKNVTVYKTKTVLKILSHLYQSCNKLGVTPLIVDCDFTYPNSPDFELIMKEFIHLTDIYLIIKLDANDEKAVCTVKKILSDMNDTTKVMIVTKFYHDTYLSCALEDRQDDIAILQEENGSVAIQGEIIRLWENDL